MNAEELFKRALNYGKRMGMGDDAEDFAQECVIKSLDVGEVRLDYLYRNYVEHQRADKRILSSAQGQLSGYRTVSLDKPLDSEDSDSAKLGDLIADSRDELGTVTEFEFYGELINGILDQIPNDETREWARKHYFKHLEGIL